MLIVVRFHTVLIIGKILGTDTAYCKQLKIVAFLNDIK